MLSKDYCLKLIEQVIDSGKHLVLDGIEVHVHGSNIATSRFGDNSMTQNQSPSRIEVSVRVIKDRRQARLSTEDLSVEGLKKVVVDAAKVASLLQPDDELPDLLEKIESENNALELSRYLNKTAELTASDRAENVKAMIAVARENKLDAAGIYATGESVTALGNSNGLFAYHRQSSAEASITMVAPHSTGWAKVHSVDADDFDATAFARTAAQKALHSANPQDIEPGAYSVILEPSATLDLLGFLWGDFAATSHIDKLSCLLDKVGTKVFGDNVTVYDDVTHPLQAGSGFDGEGVLRERVCLIDKGVVKNLVFGRRAARKLNVKPTGHGLGEPNPYGEAPRNIVMSGGTKSLSDLISSTDHAVLLTRVWYVREVDSARKIITGMTRDGTFLVKNGKVAYGVKNLRFNVSIIDLLNNILDLGKSVRAAGEESFPALVPAMKVSDFTFTSSTEF
jgi:predicted Zn-dependent protease